MPLTAVNFVTKGPVLHNDLLQFFNLFTGVMVDQPVTFKNTLTIGGNQGSTTVPLKLYGAVGQTSHLLDLYTDNTNANPGWGIAASGLMAWGPGGASPTDTFLSRVAVQNGHSSDTAGLLISPYLDVAGSAQIDGALTFKTSGATINQGTAGSLLTFINQDLTVNRFLTAGLANSVPNGSAILALGGSPTSANGGNQSIISCFGASSGAVTSGYFAGMDIGGNIGAGFHAGNAYAINIYQIGLLSGASIGTSVGLHINQVVNGSSNNWGLYIDAPSGAGAVGAVIYGGMALNGTLNHNGNLNTQVIGCNGIGVDVQGQNAGAQGNWINFGNGGEGILSNRQNGQYQFGLEFHTASAIRLAISNAGNVVIASKMLYFGNNSNPNSYIQDTGVFTFNPQNGGVNFGASGGAQNFCGVQNGGHYYATGTISGQSPGSGVNGGYAFSAQNAAGGAGIAQVWSTYSCVAHAREYGLPVEEIESPVKLMHSVGADSFKHMHFSQKIGDTVRMRPVLDEFGNFVTTQTYGFHAGEVAAAIPEAASIDPETGEAIGIDPYRLVAVLWEACQEMELRLAALESLRTPSLLSEVRAA